MNPYLKFWDLDRPLFTRVEAAADLYIPARLLAPLERLGLVCEQDAPLAVITGEPGTGKTALLRWLGERLPTATYDVLTMTIIQRESTAGWLIPHLAERLGVSAATQEKSSLDAVRAIAARLDEYIDSGRKLVVMVDAAHLIAGETAFDELAAFIHLQAVSGSCLAFVLCGGEGLPRQLAVNPEISVRIAYELRVQRLSQAESASYLEHRIRAAGARLSFESEALEVLYAASRGILTSLNAHAEGCLIEGYQRGSRLISKAVAMAASTVPQTSLAPAPEAPPPAARTVPQPAPPVESPHSSPQPPTGTEATAASGPAITLRSLFKA